MKVVTYLERGSKEKEKGRRGEGGRERRE